MIELERALEAARLGVATPEQIRLVMNSLPTDVREQLGREVFTVLGMDHTQPDAYGEKGQPLWRGDVERLAAENGQSVEAVERFISNHPSATSSPDPRVSVMPKGVPLRQPLFEESDEVDENGDPLVWASPEGAGLYLIHCASDDYRAANADAKSVRIFNSWMAMARQRGVSPIILERLRESLRKEVSPRGVLADIVRVTKKVNVVEAIGG